MIKYLMTAIAGMFLMLTAVAGETVLTVSNVKLSPEQNGISPLSFDYRHNAAAPVRKVRFFARRGAVELYLGSADLVKCGDEIKDNGVGHIQTMFESGKLPPGDYEIILKTTYTAEPQNSVLSSRSGRATLINELAKGSDVELSCRIGASCYFALRNQQTPRVDPASWQSYEALLVEDGAFYLAVIENSKWRRILETPRGSMDMTQGMHDVVYRAKGNVFELSVDGSRVFTGRDDKNLYPAGNFFLRTLDAAKPVCIDDIKLVDLNTGKVIFADDFESGKLNDSWRIGTGQWEIVKGYPATETILLGKLRAAGKTADNKLAAAQVVFEGENLKLLVNGKHTLPMLYCNLFENYPYSENIYDVTRNIYESGVRLFAPSVGGFGSPVDDRLQTRSEDILAQLSIACPDAYFLLRTGLPVPKELPQSEKIKFSDGLGDGRSHDSVDAAKAINNLSLASDIYTREFMPKLVKNLVDELKASKMSGQIMGFLITGGGYEGGWGNGGQYPKYLVDVSAAQQRQWRKYLQNKYPDVTALRAAWGNNEVDFDHLPIPSLSERTMSDLAGFRDPSVPHSRYLQDFIDMYANSNDAMRKILHTYARQEANDSLIVSFTGGVLNTAWSHIQFHPNTTANRIPDLSCNVSIETYSDRNAGGVSISTNYAYNSARLHHKMHLQEFDCASPAMPTSWAPKNWDLFTAVMRREFAVNVLMRQDAIWFFDMGFTGPWYDSPEACKELKIEQQTGQKLLEVKRETCSQIMIVPDLRQWNYFAMQPTLLAPGKTLARETSIYYMENFVTFVPEAVMRVGAASDSYTLEDLAKRAHEYKLYVFPSMGVLTPAEAKQLRQLAEDGAVCVFMGPAGMIDGNRASLDNMQQLLDIKVAVGAIGSQAFYAATGDHPVLAGLTPQDRLGDARFFDRAQPSEWYQFYIDDPTVTPLGYYADGKVAAGIKKVGKGHIVYSGSALTLPKMYRNLAQFAGVHLYQNNDDMTYADANFVTIHTFTAGPKNIKLLKKAPAVYEVFSGQLIGKDLTQFTVDLPQKQTFVYYIGDDPEILKKLQTSETEK